MARKRPTEPGLTDRSERPTTHAGFVPMEQEKQREEDALLKRAGATRRRRSRK